MGVTETFMASNTNLGISGYFCGEKGNQSCQNRNGTHTHTDSCTHALLSTTPSKWQGVGDGGLATINNHHSVSLSCCMPHSVFKLSPSPYVCWLCCIYTNLIETDLQLLSPGTETAVWCGLALQWNLSIELPGSQTAALFLCNPLNYSYSWLSSTFVHFLFLLLLWVRWQFDLWYVHAIQQHTTDESHMWHQVLIK